MWSSVPPSLPAYNLPTGGAADAAGAGEGLELQSCGR